MALPPLRRTWIHTVNWLYRWLPRLTGCHCRPERSFHWRSGLPFPICARCTGEVVGMLCALMTIAIGRPPLWVLLILLIPMVVDGSVQLLTPYESNNRRRFVTGLMFGYAFGILLMMSLAATWRCGQAFGRRYRLELSSSKTFKEVF